jgi:hypothetical protein
MSSFLCGILYGTIFCDNAISKLSFAYIFHVSMMKRTQNAGDLSEGPHPFSFRTRQLSLREPMVLARGE